MNLDGIKNYVKGNPRLECIYMALKALKDEQLAKQMIGVKRNPDNVLYMHLGNKNDDKTIYYIFFDREARFNGFCSLYRMVLMHLAYAEEMLFTPVVCFGKNTLYYDNSMDTGNAFEYYFKPVSKISFKDVGLSKRVVFSKGADGGAFGTTGGYKIPNEEISFFAEYIKKYIFLQDNVKELFWDKLESFVAGGKTLGVHVRATDFNKGYNRHPIAVTPEEYLEKTKRVIDKEGFEKVFLATDDKSVIDIFQKQFGSNLCYYDDIFRSTDGEAIHYGNQKSTREHHQYLLGLEIIKDFYTLGYCDGLIAGNSNVSMCARMLKESQQNKYKYLEIIDKGTNHNMHETRSKFNSMLKENKK